MNQECPTYICIQFSLVIEVAPEKQVPIALGQLLDREHAILIDDYIFLEA